MSGRKFPDRPAVSFKIRNHLPAGTQGQKKRYPVACSSFFTVPVSATINKFQGSALKP